MTELRRYSVLNEAVERFASFSLLLVSKHLRHAHLAPPRAGPGACDIFRPWATPENVTTVGGPGRWSVRQDI